MANLLGELFNSVSTDDLKSVTQILNENPELLKKPTSIDGQNWLHTAAHHNSLSVAKFLVEKGIDVNSTDNNGDVPLHCAAYKNAQKVSKWLLDNGAHVDGVDLEHSTPLVSAIIKSNFEMVKLLVERGAKLDLTFTKNKNNIKDVMSFAKIYNNQGIIDYLKEQVK